VIVRRSQSDEARRLDDVAALLLAADAEQLGARKLDRTHRITRPNNAYAADCAAQNISFRTQLLCHLAWESTSWTRPRKLAPCYSWLAQHTGESGHAWPDWM
jgi:hypothetical protein